MKIFTNILAGVFVIALTATSLNGAISLPAPSPLQTITQKVGYSDVKITYSRPISRGRDIFGALVPYGKLWRTGANGATLLEFSEDAVVGGISVPAGNYSLLTIPGKKKWTIILNSKTEKFSPPGGYDESLNVASFTVPSKKLKTSVKELGIQIVGLTYEQASVQLTWEKTQVEFDLVFDTHTKATAEIEKLLGNAEDANPYEFVQAASYYFYANKDAGEALRLVDEFIAKAEKAPFWAVYLRAEILAKLGKTTEAIEAAELSIKLANEQGGEVWGAKYADWAAKLIKRIQ